MTDTALLKYHIAKAGFTQAKLAEKLNVSVQTINIKVTGKREFSIAEIMELTKLLGLTLDEKERIFFAQ